MKEQSVSVLIIDEHEAVCAALARRVEALGAFRVVQATSNPVLATEIAHQFSPQLILADFKRGPRPRPEMAAWMLRSSPQSRLIIYGSYYTEGEREAFAEAGVSRCLLKGMSAKDLSAELHAVARNGHSHGSS